MKDISVEYAHIYTNQKVDEEHQLSLTILEELKKQAEKSGESLSLVVMVDDYSFPDPSFSYDDFGKWLADHGHKPDIILRESQLIPLCDEVIKIVTDQKLKNELTEYVKAKKYPCSLFIAAWYLLRLGYLKDPNFNEEISANKLLNILPQSFKPYEDRGLDIIKNTSYAKAIESIDYKFIDGRKLS